MTTRPDWYRLAAPKGDRAELFIYDDIGPGLLSNGVMAADLTRELDAIKAKHLDVRINSNGGSVFEGLAIYNALQRHPARVVTHVDGIAASIASVIALAGVEVHMAKNSFLMIHNPWAMAYGDAAELRTVAERLDKVSGTIVGTYRDKSGRTDTEVRAWMNAETWFNAQDALAAGLADQVTEDQQMAARADVSRFRNVPSQLRASGPPVPPDPEPVPEPPKPDDSYGPLGEMVTRERIRLKLLGESLHQRHGLP